MTQLAELYDGDKFRTREDVSMLRELVWAPHPLTGVRYADGIIQDTTAGKVHTPKPPFGGYKQ